MGHDQLLHLPLLKDIIDITSIVRRTGGLVTMTLSGLYSVDTFFYLGGFLVCITMLPQILKHDFTILFYLKLILHRFIRIWPAMFVAIMLFWKIFPILAFGPLNNGLELASRPCGTISLLYNLLFINNFQRSDENQCFAWGWYLANDFQFYIITPFLLVAYKKRKIFGILFTSILLIGSILYAYIMS